MFKRAVRPLRASATHTSNATTAHFKARQSTRFHSSTSGQNPSSSAYNTNLQLHLKLAGLGLTTCALFYGLGGSRVIFNDALPPPYTASVQPVNAKDIFSVGLTGEDDQIATLVWGSNRSNILSPEAPEVDVVRTPGIVAWSKGIALRDLALHDTHAACVDARGDVYQWGDGFFADSAKQREMRKPIRTLAGKNIKQLQMTASRVFALSESGDVYVLSSDVSKQALRGDTPSTRSWWSLWLIPRQSTIDYVQLKARAPLSWGERFEHIACGEDHLLAVTSSGRTFAHPITKSANTHGQLGIRHFDIPAPLMPGSRVNVELLPLALEDSKLVHRKSPSDAEMDAQDLRKIGVDDTDIRFSDGLFEVPALRGVKVLQVAAGARSSYARTDRGSILAWGANNYGQMAMGSTVTVDTVSVPTEINLSRLVPGKIRSRCLDVCAGGDLACLTVERLDEQDRRTVDVLMFGNGRWGGLGNNLFSSSQGTPVRARNVSGLLEFSEDTQSMQAIEPHAISISPTGHVLLALETHARSGPGGGGRDLFVWGTNHDSQLGNGRRTSLPAPTNLLLPDGSRMMLMKLKAAVRDMGGRLWARKALVEQYAVAGPGTSVVYWRLC